MGIGRWMEGVCYVVGGADEFLLSIVESVLGEIKQSLQETNYDFRTLVIIMITRLNIIRVKAHLFIELELI